MKVEISSNQVIFCVETIGAEPWILRPINEETNYIWRPSNDPEKSGGTAICFPLLGAVPNGKYTLNGKEYKMEMHGFAQHSNFDIIEQNENTVLMEIKDSPDSYSQFPYAFRFQVLYSVENRTLKTEYRIINNDTKEMFFSVGGHPRFSCPIGNNEKGLRFSDYFLEFEKPHPPQSVAKSFCPLDTIKQFSSIDGRILHLDYILFEKGSFCYSRSDNRKVTLKCVKDSRSITMRSEGNAFLTIWNSPGEPFLAVEPWYGSISSLPVNPIIDGDWMARQGNLCLGSGNTYTVVYYITI